LSAHRPDVPPQVATIVMRCLRRDWSQRAANVAEIALALSPYAPLRAHPIAERIGSLFGAVGPMVGRASVPGSGTPSIPVLASSQALGGSQAPRKKGGVTGALIAVAALAVLGGLGFGVRKILDSQRGATVGADATSAPSVDLTKLLPAGVSAVSPQ